jgi:hypothetical protein
MDVHMLVVAYTSCLAVAFACNNARLGHDTGTVVTLVEH